jgi:hypothetical protein
MGVVRFQTWNTLILGFMLKKVFNVPEDNEATSSFRPLTSTESSHLRPSDIRTDGS